MEDFDPNALDEVIHGRLRLGVMAYLASVREASFPELALQTKATNGNLSVHLRKLEEAGYVAQQKRFVGRKPQTLLSLTDKGREAWLAYLGQLETLVNQHRTDRPPEA